MPTPYWGNFGGDQVLYLMLTSKGLYVAAHQADPTPAGLLSTELAGDGYVRDVIRFTNPSGKAVVNAVGFGWHALAASLISHFAIWTAISAGSLIYVHPLTHPIRIPDSGHASVAKGDWAIQL